MGALLGTAPDPEVAEVLGLSRPRVAYQRKVRGIRPFRKRNPEPSGHRWTPREIAILGTMSDRSVGRIVGLSAAQITLRRKNLVIAPFRKKPLEVN